MRYYEYIYFPSIGTEVKHVIGSLFLFLVEIPSLFYFMYVPPLRVVNSFLSEGVANAGMSGGAKWKPFALTEIEYEEMLKELRLEQLSHIDHPFIFCEVPMCITSKEEWASWVLSHLKGVPFEQLLHLMQDERHLKAECDIAREIGGEAAIDAHMKWLVAASAYSHFITPYLRSNRNIS